MPDSIAFLARAIEQGRGATAADLVLKGGRIFDLSAATSSPAVHRPTL